MGKPKAPCGTDAAYRRHLREGAPVDEACRDAHASVRRESRRSPTAAAPTAGTSPRPTPPPDDELDDMELIVKTLRTAFVTIAEQDPTKLAPIAREFRSAVEAKRGPAEPVKEMSLADQLAAARAARAARASSPSATA